MIDPMGCWRLNAGLSGFRPRKCVQSSTSGGLMDLRIARARLAIRVVWRKHDLPAFPLHHALYGARSPSRHFVEEVRNILGTYLLGNVSRWRNAHA